jgi:hypothetical protein
MRSIKSKEVSPVRRERPGHLAIDASGQKEVGMMESRRILKKRTQCLEALKSETRPSVEPGQPVALTWGPPSMPSSVTIEAELAPGIPRTVNVPRKAPRHRSRDATSSRKVGNPAEREKTPG